MKGHDDMRKGGCFSIFLGQQSDEEEMLDYLAGDFAYDFGFEINPADGPEYDASAEPVEIEGDHRRRPQAGPRSLYSASHPSITLCRHRQKLLRPCQAG